MGIHTNCDFLFGFPLKQPQNELHPTNTTRSRFGFPVPVGQIPRLTDALACAELERNSARWRRSSGSSPHELRHLRHPKSGAGAAFVFTPFTPTIPWGIWMSLQWIQTNERAVSSENLGLCWDKQRCPRTPKVRFGEPPQV